jgi:hypothetical protein
LWFHFSIKKSHNFIVKTYLKVMQSHNCLYTLKSVFHM